MAWATKKWTAGENHFFPIQESDGTAKNVSGYTITLKVEMGNTLLISGACVIASATTGYVYYTLSSGDLPYVGKANYELELSMSGVKIMTETYPIHIGRVI